MHNNNPKMPKQEAASSTAPSPIGLQLFNKNFVVLTVATLLMQFYKSPETLTGPNGSILTFILYGVASIFGLGIIILLIRNYRKIYCIVTTFPRDIRGGWRFFSAIRYVKWAEKNKLTVAKIFDSYADKKPDKVCFYYEDQEWTYKQVQQMSNRIGNYFAQRGFKKGDIVSLFMENRPEFACIWLGLNKIGVCTAWVNYNLRLQPLQHCFETVNSKAIIYGHELSPAIKDLLELDQKFSSVPMFCSGHNGSPLLHGTIDMDSEIKRLPHTTPILNEEFSVNDGICFIFTSGTTGMPKAAMVKQHRFLIISVGMRRMNKVTEDDILYDSLPMYHMTGGMVGIGQVLYGTPVVIRKRFSASQFWKDCVKYNVTVAQYLGETLRYLLAQPPSPEEKMHTVRLLSGNGLRKKIWRAVVERFNIPAVGEVYGSTEGNCNMSNIDSKVGAVGFVPIIAYPFLPMTLIKIDEETGEPLRHPKSGLAIRCKPNETGELVGKIISQHPIRDFHGYTDKAATSKKILRDVFSAGDVAFRTGDLLIMDEFGYFYFRDRTGDSFRWKGENVSTTEVETIISTYCTFKDAVVYGVEVPDNEGKAGMVAISDPDGLLDLDALAAGMEKSLPSYARPLFLRVLSEMDVTGTYKMKKNRLQSEGFDITRISDPLYFLHKGSYTPLQKELYENINSGTVRV